MGRGERESQCINAIYEFIGSSKFDKHCFGMNASDVDIFVKAINEAKNIVDKNVEDNSKFPDFRLKNGFIEHFQVSATKEKKGSEYKQFEKEFNKQIQDSETEEFVTTMMPQPASTYSLFESFLIRKWVHHIESRDKYDGNKDVGIFVIDFDEFSLQMFESKYDSDVIGLRMGDYSEAEYIKGYRLSRDKHLLSYMYNFVDKISYVCFLSKVQGNLNCDIISVRRIPILSNYLNNYEIMSCDYTGQYYSKHCIMKRHQNNC